jgi:hypothetical protein
MTRGVFTGGFVLPDPGIPNVRAPLCAYCGMPTTLVACVDPAQRIILTAQCSVPDHGVSRMPLFAPFASSKRTPRPVDAFAAGYCIEYIKGFK